MRIFTRTLHLSTGEGFSQNAIFSYRAKVLPVPILEVDQVRKIPEKMGTDEILFFSLTRKKQKA